MRSFLLISGLFTLSNISVALAGPPRATTPQVDLGYELHTGFLNVKSSGLTLGSTLTDESPDNGQLLQLLQYPLRSTTRWKPTLHGSPATFYSIAKADK
jgi:hypothetical protein